MRNQSKLRRVGAQLDDFEGRIKINSLSGLRKLLKRPTVEVDFARVVSLNVHHEGDDRSLEYLEHMTELENFSLVSSGITDHTLRRLSALPRLLYLHLADNALISDQGIAWPAKLQSLKELVLRQPQVSDVGCRYLTSLRNLTSLVIDVSGMTDAGVGSLSDLTSLTLLNLENATCISSEVIRELHERVDAREPHT